MGLDQPLSMRVTAVVEGTGFTANGRYCCSGRHHFSGGLYSVHSRSTGNADPFLRRLRSMRLACLSSPSRAEFHSAGNSLGSLRSLRKYCPCDSQAHSGHRMGALNWRDLPSSGERESAGGIWGLPSLPLSSPSFRAREFASFTLRLVSKRAIKQVFDLSIQRAALSFSEFSELGFEGCRYPYQQ